MVGSFEACLRMGMSDGGNNGTIMLCSRFLGPALGGTRLCAHMWEGTWPASSRGIRRVLPLPA